MMVTVTSSVLVPYYNRTPSACHSTPSACHSTPTVVCVIVHLGVRVYSDSAYELLRYNKRQCVRDIIRGSGAYEL